MRAGNYLEPRFSGAIRNLPAGIVARGSGATKDGVGADAPPDDVRLTDMDLIAVFKGRSAVRRPTHLPDPRMSLHPLDAEARMKALLGLLQISDELPEGS
jgi:hypothetical protein